MKIQISIEGNLIYGDTTITNHVSECGRKEYSSLIEELDKIKEELAPDCDLYEAVSALQNSLRTENDSKVKDTIKRYSKEFSIPLFANLASEALMRFINGRL